MRHRFCVLNFISKLQLREFRPSSVKMENQMVYLLLWLPGHRHSNIPKLPTHALTLGR